jgi:hypothetical protein
MKPKDDKEYIESKDIITEKTLHDILLIWGDRITHMEDALLDIRTVMIKLVKQNNQVVSFLKQLEADVDEQYGITAPPSFDEAIEEKMKGVQDMVDEFIDKNEELKKFEKELEKHKDKITPGQAGES